MLRALTLLAVFAWSVPASAEEPKSPPAALRISIEDLMYESYCAEIVPGTSIVVYRSRTIAEAEGTKKEKIDIPKDRWPIFWQRLDEAKVWNWKKHYSVSPNPPDGTVWSVTVDWNGRTVNSSGVNAFPDAKQFAALKTAVSELLGGRKFE